MEHILLLHGAIGASDQLQELATSLSDFYEVHLLNFSGHGGGVLPEEPFSISLFADDVLSYIDANGIPSAHIFGYSMGGYVGMYIAKNYPERINKLMTLATKYYWDDAVAAREIQMLDAEKIEAKIPAFAEVLKKRHAPNDWKGVLSKTTSMLIDLGRKNTLDIDDYSEVKHSCLILLGDRDKMVSLEETIKVFKALPNAQMGMIPGTPHPIEQVDLEMLSFMIRRFLG